ncbi:MAG: nitronate monooxygenase [Deltaproteobacteria bacterium]|nr:MAG: nitronate monooxygenase [Deltaproteobacteria bacterium]
MFKTKITELLGIEYPIIGGTMMHLSRSEFVAAISETGCLGILASANYMDKESFRKAIRKIRSKTDNPFAVNLNMFPARRRLDNNAYIDVIIDEGVPIVETSGHKAPEEYVDRLKSAGVKLIHKCVGVRYAKKAESLGVDAVTVVGYENGGATGVLDITTLCLVPRVVDNVNIPVIAGGGVVDGRGVAAILSLGADGVIMGTRLLAAQECPLHPNVKRRLLEASELDTMLVLRSVGNTHRVWKNKAAQTTAEMEQRGATLEELFKVISGDQAKKMYFEGDPDAGLLACGQGIGLVREIKPVKEIIAQIVEETQEAISRLNTLTGIGNK